MTAIEVDFEVYKELTSRRTSEDHSYNDVIRALLRLPTKQSASPAKPSGVWFGGVKFPDGTQFRATYKGRTYTAEIRDGEWRDSDGTRRNSPSEAAVRITGSNWNGWRFWYCQRPGEPSWVLLDKLRPNNRLQRKVDEILESI